MKYDTKPLRSTTMHENAKENRGDSSKVSSLHTNYKSPGGDAWHQIARSEDIFSLRHFELPFLCKIVITLHRLSAAFSGADLNRKSGLEQGAAKTAYCCNERCEVREEVEIGWACGSSIEPQESAQSSNGV